MERREERLLGILDWVKVDRSPRQINKTGEPQSRQITSRFSLDPDTLLTRPQSQDSDQSADTEYGHTTDRILGMGYRHTDRSADTGYGHTTDQHTVMGYGHTTTDQTAVSAKIVPNLLL